MKRNMDLIRALLLKLESWPIERGDIVHIQPTDPRLPEGGHSIDEMDYHVDLLMGAGFISGPDSQPVEGIMFRRLSWQGHDFLDSVRDPKIWERTKKGVEGAGGFTVELMKELAKGFVKKQIEEYTGVKL
jgi:hypothetical protein